MAFSPWGTQVSTPPSEGSSTVVSVEVEGELADAISSISDAAEEDSLLKNPFQTTTDFTFEGEPFEYANFVSPLSGAERNEIAQIDIHIQKYQELIDIHSAQPLHIRWVFAPSIIQWAVEITRLTIRKNSLVRKEQIAYQQWFAARQSALRQHNDAQAAARADALASAEAELDAANAAIIEEFQEQLDKFSQWDSEGLSGLSKRVRPQFERKARNYISDEPDILFASEYVVDGKSYGSLICFKRYRDSTHYEIFKRNVFQGSDFERFLFLDRASLISETEKLIPYVNKALGLKLNRNKVFLVLDHRVKNDRIYEYKIAAARVPAKAKDVDYDLILEVQELLKRATLNSSATIDLRSFAGNTLGSTDLGWVLSTVNETIPLFGRSPTEQPLASVMVNPVIEGNDYIVDVPKNINDVLCVIQESITVFGARNTMVHLVNVLGGLPREFVQSFNNSIDDDANRFSFDIFKQELEEKVSIFRLIFEIAETQDEDALEELSTMNVQLPNEFGTESVTTVLGLSRIFRFLNDIYLISTYAQEDDTFERLVQIRALIEINREDEDPVETAVQAQADFLTAEVALATTNEFNLYGVVQDQNAVFVADATVVATTSVAQNFSTLNGVWGI